MNNNKETFPNWCSFLSCTIAMFSTEFLKYSKDKLLLPSQAQFLTATPTVTFLYHHFLRQIPTHLKLFSVNFNTVKKAMPRLTWLVASLSPQKEGLHIMLDLWKTKWHWDRIYWAFPEFSSHHHSTSFPYSFSHLFNTHMLQCKQLIVPLNNTINDIVYQC